MKKKITLLAGGTQRERESVRCTETQLAAIKTQRPEEKGHPV